MHVTELHFLWVHIQLQTYNRTCCRLIYRRVVFGRRIINPWPPILSASFYILLVIHILEIAGAYFCLVIKILLLNRRTIQEGYIFV